MKQLLLKAIHYFQEQYVTVLAVLAVVVAINYFVVIDKLKEQEGSAILLKLSTDQSNMINVVNFLTIKMLTADRQEFNDLRSSLISHKTLLKDNYITLSSGNFYIREEGRLKRVSGTLPKELRRVYFQKPIELDRRFERYISALNRILKIKYENLDQSQDIIYNLHGKVSIQVLKGQETVSIFYQRHNEYLLGQTISLQNVTFLLAIGAIVLVGSVLLKPLVENLRKATSSARAEKAFADNVINTAETLIIGVGREEQIVLFNNYAESLSGWGEEEILDQNFFSMFFDQAGVGLLKPVYEGMMGGEIEFADEIETQMKAQTGEMLDILWHMTIVMSQKNEPQMFLATGLDITERKQAELLVQQANQEMEKLNLRLTSEVDLAATLQQSILPEPDIDLPGLMGKAALLTSSEVGGDFYDYYKVGGHQSVLLVGDVSGHGVAAGTMVSAAKAGVYPLVHEGVSNPSEILHSLNETMLATAQQSLLMTMACLSLDATTGKLEFANAGHVLPYLWRRNEGQWQMLEASGLPLGKSIDADYRTTSIETTLDVGDRLFLYTDGIVEEESLSGEAFGYDRLEQFLEQYGELDPVSFREKLLEALLIHCDGREFEDDVTIVLINHSDRVESGSGMETEASDIIRLTESYYRKGHRPVPRVPREFVVFIAESEYADLLPRFSSDGLCRILPQHDDFCKQIGWDHLLNQHHESLDDDVYELLPHSPLQRQFQLTHTDDKLFVMEEIQSWLTDLGTISNDHVDTFVVVLDEMIENSLYAAPRDGKGVPYFEKGVSRELSEIDEVRIDVVISDNKLGLMITDNWGTLTPAVFLKNISHALEDGVEAGKGGAGLYMMWRLSDYFQIRVFPQKKTQVTTLWNLNAEVNMDTSSGFQFIHHSDLDSSVQMGA